MIKILEFEKNMQNDVREFIIKNMQKELNIKNKEIFYRITSDLDKIHNNYIKNNGEFLIAYDEDCKKIIGTIAMKYENKIPVLKRFYVSDKYRRMKVGYLLYKTLEEKIKQKEITNIYLISGKELESAHKFYSKNGWIIEHNNPGFFVREGAHLYKKNMEEKNMEIEKYKILKDLVSFNTIKDAENKKIINYIENYLKKFGFKTEYKTKDLIMSIGNNPKLGFLGHTDTVEYIDEFKSPFNLKIENEYIYGLGVCDMKGGISAMLDAISQIDFKKLKYGIKVYFTYDEEIGFSGINELLHKKEVYPEYMIFGEPTNNEIYTGHKGLMEYEINFKGLKTHSSTPNKGISANMNAVKFLYELENFYTEKIKIYENSCYDIPYTTMNVGIINGGSATNSVSAHCKVTLDFRIIENEHIDIINNKIDELIKKYNADKTVIDIIESFVDKIDFLNNTKTTNFMTEASKVPNSKRIILGTGPVTAHEVNEHISIQSYEKLIEQYKDLIYKICVYEE